MAGSTTTRGGSADHQRRGGAEVSPAAKLTGFLILVILMFIAAYAAGARLGPVTTGRSQPGHGQPMHMNMGASTGPARAGR